MPFGHASGSYEFRRELSMLRESSSYSSVSHSLLVDVSKLTLLGPSITKELSRWCPGAVERLEVDLE